MLKSFQLEEAETNEIPKLKLNKFNQPYIVSNATIDDIGKYSCSIDNGIQNAIVQSYILFPPIQKLSKEINHIFTNEEITLTCSVIVKYLNASFCKSNTLINHFYSTITIVN